MVTGHLYDGIGNSGKRRAGSAGFASGTDGEILSADLVCELSGQNLYQRRFCLAHQLVQKRANLVAGAYLVQKPDGADRLVALERGRAALPGETLEDARATVLFDRAAAS